MEFAKALVLLGGGSLAVTLVALAFTLLRSDEGNYRRNRKRSGSMANVISGNVKSHYDGRRDYVVSAGLAVNNNNEWVEQGKLSDDALDAVLK